MTKTDDARQLALKLVKQGIDYNTARTTIKEDIPCSKTLAHQSYRWAEKQLKTASGKLAIEQPEIEVVDEKKKTPEFLKDEEKPEIEEIEPTPEGIELPSELQEELAVFRDMMRGLYVLLISKEGLLGEKYGRSKDQCVQVSDQLYRWLCRRITAEELEKYDTILLVGSHIALIAPPIVEYIKERREQRAKEEAEKKKKEPEGN